MNRIVRNIFKPSCLQKQDGFVIFVIPVLFLIFGVFMSSMKGQAKPTNFYFESQTKDSQYNIRKTLSAYAHKNFRIPCPGDPTAAGANFGTEDPGGIGVSGGSCTRTSGILPFRTLGLPEHAAKDEWGNFYTYRVSPDFTRNLDAGNFDWKGQGGEQVAFSNTNSESQVHQMCRTTGWVDNDTGYFQTDGSPSNYNADGSDQAFNRNIYKASFCCASNVIGGQEYSFNKDSDDYKALYEEMADKSDDLYDQNDNHELSLEKLSLGNGITLGVEALDKNAIVTMKDDQVDAKNKLFESVVKNPRFAYIENRTGTNHNGKPLAGSDLDSVPGGFGPDGNRKYGAGPGAKYWRTTAVIDMSGDDDYGNKLNVKDATITFSDVGTTDWNKPIPITVHIADENGDDLIDISYTVNLDGQEHLDPSNIDGLVDLKISLQDIAADDTSFLYQKPNNPNAHNSKMVRNQFSQSRQAVIDAIRAKNAPYLDSADDAMVLKELSKYRLKTVKASAAHASIGFNSFSYTNGGALQDSDLVVVDEANQRRIDERDTIASYGNSSAEYTAAVSEDFEAVAYVLISHGENGEGAYSRALGGARINNIADALENPAELDNAQDAGPIHDIRRAVSDNLATSFDDIIMWDTQFSLYNALKSGTCEGPQTPI